MKQAKKVLSVVLALAMVFAMSIMVSAATPAATNVEVTDNGDTVSVAVYGGGAISTFDYGVAFNENKLEYVSTEFGATVKENFTDILKAQAKTNYVVLVGVNADSSYEAPANTLIGTVTFSKKAGATIEAKDLEVVTDAQKRNIVTTENGFEVTPKKEGQTFDAPTKVEEIKTPAPAKTTEPTTAPTEDSNATAAPTDNSGNNTNTGDNSGANTGSNTGANTGANTAKNGTAATTAAATASASTTSKSSTTAAKKTADTASVVIPVAAIVAAAAAVVAVSKKKVEE